MEEKNNVWKEAGKDVEQTISELGKAIIRSIKIGAERILNEDDTRSIGVRESWKNVGRKFETAGNSVSRAVAQAARELADMLDSEAEQAEDAVFEAVEKVEEEAADTATETEPDEGETAESDQNTVN